MCIFAVIFIPFFVLVCSCGLDTPRASISVSGSSSPVVVVFPFIVVAWVCVGTYVEFVEVGHVITPISIADPTPYQSASPPQGLLSFLSLWSDGQLYTTIPGFFCLSLFPRCYVCPEISI